MSLSGERRRFGARVSATALVLAGLLPALAGGQATAPTETAPARPEGTASQPDAAIGAGKAEPGQKTPAGPVGPPAIDARAWILIDPRDGEVLASSASDRELSIASATKLMTAYLALRELKPKQKLTAPPYNALPAESLIDLRAGEKMTVKDLLYGLVLESGNDAAVTLAEGVSGSVPRFVARMNREAQALGLTASSFANPIGLDDPGNYSSAADLAKLAEKLLEHPLFAQIADSETAVLRSGDAPRRLTSRNTLLGSDPTVDGVKTGHTLDAGWVLVGSATRKGTQLVSVVLGARSEAGRDAETEELLDYGFSLYRAEQPVTAGEELADPKLDYRDERLPLVSERAITISAREGQPVETLVEAPEEVSGAVEEGERLGEVIVTVDGDEAASAPLVAANAVEAATLADKTVATVQNPVILIPAGAIVILVGALLAARRGRPEDGEEQPPSPPKRERGPRERTPEERRKMHEERMRRRREQEGKGR